MISVGIDIGAQNVKVVILKDDKEVLARHSGLKGLDWRVTLDEVLQAALEEAGLSRDDVQFITATGAGSRTISFATGAVTGVIATARGTNFLLPAVRTVVDVGAEDARSIKCDGNGKVVEFIMNDKCAAGSGTFVESMARAMEVGLEEFGQLSLRSTKTVPMNAQCAVFAESEVVSLIHAKTSPADIAQSVHNAMAERIAALTQRVGVEKDVALIGGVAHNVGFVECMKKALDIEFIIPEGPEYITALGAALSHD